MMLKTTMSVFAQEQIPDFKWNSSFDILITDRTRKEKDH